MTPILESPLGVALGWALLHFLWQGVVIAIAALFFWRLRLGAHANYLAGIVALSAMLLAPIVTMVYADGRGQARVSIAGTSAPMTEAAGSEPVLIAGPVAASGQAAAAWLDATGLPLAQRLREVAPAAMLGIWVAGVIFLSVRLLGGWVVARRLVTRDVTPATPEIERFARRVAEQLALGRAVRVLLSRAVTVPVLVGWLRPVVLIPMSVVSGLTPTQVESLLAHEFAHVRRHDYLVNLLQSVVETLLFYHPAVWWVSGRVRAEREHCCDDLAVSVSDRLTYATALTDLAGLVAAPRLALAATDGSLGERVRRILGEPRDERPASGGWLAALFVISLAIGLLTPDTFARSAAALPLPPGGSEPEQEARETVPPLPSQIRAGLPPASGVPDAMLATADGQAARAQTEVEALARLKALRAADLDAEARFLVQQYELDRKRIELERGQERTWLLGEVRLVEAELEKLKAEAARVQRMVDVGVANPAAVSDVRARLAQFEGRLAHLQTNREAVNEHRLLELHELEQRMERERHRVETLRTEHEIAGETGRLSEQLQRERNLTALRHELDAVEERLRREFSGTADRFRDAADQSRAIASGDHIGIVIAGEPDLPQVYQVSESGTIRLPFLGTMRVAGRTTEQVRAEIAKVLVERRLVTSPVVEVRIKEG